MDARGAESVAHGSFADDGAPPERAIFLNHATDRRLAAPTTSHGEIGRIGMDIARLWSFDDLGISRSEKHGSEECPQNDGLQSGLQSDGQAQDSTPR